MWRSPLRKIMLFLIVSISLILWFASTLVMQFAGPGVPTGMEGMMGTMGRMMGGRQAVSQSSSTSIFQAVVWPAVFVASASIAVIAVGGYLLAPEIPYKQPVGRTDTNFRPVETVMKVVKEDERKVLKTLMQAGGKMTQRDIARQAQFTRLKTHRIIARLAEREILVVQKHGNTNMITLPKWLQGAGSPTPSGLS